MVPLFQTIPIFGFIFGFIFIREHLSFYQIAGSLITIIGAIMISLEITKEEHLRFKKRILVFMLCSSFCFALYETLFKVAALEEGFWVSTFWQYVGLFIFGFILFISKKNYRDDFIFLIKQHNWKLFFINILNESTTIIGNTFYNFSLLLAPIALIMTINAYQPVFVFIEGILLSIFFPHIINENLSIKNIGHKFIAISIICVGTIIMYNN